VVITEEQAIRLLSEANPVPDASTVDVNRTFPATRLAELDKRSSEMNEIEYERSDTKPISGGRRLAGIATAIAALVVAGVFLSRTTDESPVAAQPAAPAVEVATAFVEAYGSFDVDLASSYLAADADLSLLDGGQQEWRLGNRFAQATGAEFLIGTCEELGSSTPATSVRCPFDFHGLRSNEIGLGPYSGSFFDFTLDDGEITSVAMRWSYMGNGFNEEMWTPFFEWVETTHPEDLPIMYSGGSITSQRWTEASIDLWEQRLREYVAEVTGPNAGATIGLPGIAPAEAIPSTPENGELVASMWEHIGAPGDFGNGWLYLYADGRLIWAQADPNPTGGWLEQRLTPAGVELIRSEIIATGLFDSDQPASASNDGFPREVNGGSVQVRNGGRLVYVNRVVPQLMERLAELWSWLPDDAWEDAETKPYVPSRYAVCLHYNGNTAPTDAPDGLSLIPVAARNLLANASQLQTELAAVDPGGMVWLEGSNESCYDVTAEEARTLATALNGAEGIEELPQRSYDGSEVFYLLSVTLEEYNQNPFNAFTLAIWPMLPHGVPAFTGA
jgi:hypothetical protein